jgi:uncharacterized RDD family membrane protein YckC
MIDTIFRLETPEGIDLSISPAGPVGRGLALAIDSAIRWGALLAVGLAISSLGEMGIGIFAVLFFLAEWFYPVFFEVLWNGQTPGKQALGLRVVNGDGTPIGWSASLIRNLLRVADLLPLFYVAGVVSVLCSDRMQRLGDLAAGTLVINTRDAKLSIGRPREIDARGASHTSVTLRPEEQRAILSFAERRGELSGERAQELAGLLEPLTGAAPGEAASELVRIANGLAGRS